jgi:hypothetical protein
MWKKAVIYFLLLSFINTAFLPGEKVDETPFNGIEEVEEEYNSLYELVEEGLMGVQDTTPEDEDDDIPDWLKKTTDFYYHHNLEITILTNTYSLDYKSFVSITPYFSFLEISSPPPKLV